MAVQLDGVQVTVLGGTAQSIPPAGGGAATQLGGVPVCPAGQDAG